MKHAHLASVASPSISPSSVVVFLEALSVICFVVSLFCGVAVRRIYGAEQMKVSSSSASLINNAH